VTDFERLDGPATSLVSARPGPDLSAVGWLDEEYVARGTAVRYTGELSSDGCLDLRAGDSAEFATRVAVRRPGDPAAFSGTLVVEWLNVSSGQDAAPGWTFLAEEVVRRGHAWAGVSAQHMGVEGGDSAVQMAGLVGLREADAVRYADLRHPGDAYCYDLFTQVASALADGPLRELSVRTRLAVGESQSAFTLTTYVNGVQPLVGLFDGFLVHSRGGALAPVGEPGTGLVMAEVVTAPAVRFRSDLAAPVLCVQTETDLFGHLGYLPARQPDTDRLRVWEVAGTAHADKFVIGEFEEFLACDEPVNRGQQVFVLRAALRHLEIWATGGQAPPSAPPLATDGDGFQVDENGNALGGVRTPCVDAPVAVLSGLPSPGASLICRLFGTTKLLTPERLRELYPSNADYLSAYAAATDAAIHAGFLLEDDRADVLADARPHTIH